MSEHSEQQFDEKWFLPEKFRITPELTPETQRLVREADEKQKELLSIFGNPFARQTPLMRERARAVMIRNRFEALGQDAVKNLPDVQKTEFANACAILGRYDLAAHIAPTEAERSEYQDIWLAVLRDEADICPHPDKHHYAEKDVYSVKLEAEAVLMKCNICRFRNVKPLPGHIAAGRQKRSENRERFKGMSFLEVRQLR